MDDRSLDLLKLRLKGSGEERVAFRVRKEDRIDLDSAGVGQELLDGLSRFPYLVLMVIGVAGKGKPRTRTMWVNHFDLLPGASEVTTSFNSTSSGVGGG
jgi:hypothetical protein